MIGVIQYSMKNPRHQILGFNIIDNRLSMENYLCLMIWSSKTIGKNITRGQTSGIVTAKKKIKPSGVIARTINHRQNAASGRSYLSSDGATL